MSSDVNQPPKEIQQIMAQVPDARAGNTESFDAKGAEGYSEKLVDAIEMIGEEKAAGLDAAAASQVTPGMRYLHSSRTIHQLVTDRNRAVGIYLAVASLLLTASGAILNANPPGVLLIPIAEIQRWCFPLAFLTLAGLGFFIAFLLIRTRVGLIYEVAKMNALLGLPIGRVQRVSPFSIHFILQALVSCGAGASAASFIVFMTRWLEPDWNYRAVGLGAVIGVIVTASLLILDFVTVSLTTADHRLQRKVEQ
jgi:hypothetical protein